MTEDAQRAARTQVELSLLAQDVNFLVLLWPRLRALLGSQFAALSFPLTSYSSLVLWESYQYLHGLVPELVAGVDLARLEATRQTRHMFKLFDRPAEYLDHLRAVTEYQMAVFKRPHQGWARAWIRLLQPDQGVFLIEGHPVSSTTTGTLVFWGEAYEVPEPSEWAFQMGRKANEHSYFMGELLAGVAAAFPTKGIDLTFSVPRAFEVTHEDFKSRKRYARIYNEGSGPQALNAALLQVHIHINYIRHFLCPIVKSSSLAFFKLKYLYLYHVVDSLSRIRNLYWAKGELSDRSKDFFRQISARRHLRLLVGAAGFRNLLVHYKLDAQESGSLKPNLGLAGLSYQYFGGLSILEVTEILEEEITALSDLLNALYRGGR